MEEFKKVGPKKIIFGEGCVSPVFMGSVYMQDANESNENAAWRFNESMKSLGFEWLPKMRKP